MKKIAFLLCVLLLLCGCSGKKYRAEDFIGRSSGEIESIYGTFDCVGMPPCTDGLYKNTRCGYTLRPAKQGLPDKEEELLFFILFDKDGIAVSCENGYRPGG